MEEEAGWIRFCMETEHLTPGHLGYHTKLGRFGSMTWIWPHRCQCDYIQTLLYKQLETLGVM